MQWFAIAAQRLGSHSHSLSQARVVRLFSSPTCTLCEPVKELLVAAVEQHRLSARPVHLEVVDISRRENIAFHRQYRFDIPVVTLDGVEIARHRLTQEQLTAALALRD